MIQYLKIVTERRMKRNGANFFIMTFVRLLETIIIVYNLRCLVKMETKDAMCLIELVE